MVVINKTIFVWLLAPHSSYRRGHVSLVIYLDAVWPHSS